MENIDLLLNRPLPSDGDSEKAILGSIILNNNLFTDAMELLEPSYFFNPIHRSIYNAMFRVFEKGIIIDPLTIKEEIVDVPVQASIITELTYGLPSTDNIENWCEIIKGKAIRRQIISVCNLHIAEALDEDKTNREILTQFESNVYEIADAQRSSIMRLKKADEIVHDAIRKTYELSESNEDIIGIRSNLVDLDALTLGWQDTDLIVLAGRPSMGKTALALQQASEAAFTDNKLVVFFSLEMSEEQVAYRLLASGLRIDGGHLKTGNLSEEAWPRLEEFSEVIRDKGLYIIDTPGIDVNFARGVTRRIEHEEDRKLDLVIFDYIQLMESARERDTRLQEVTQISRELKTFAKEMDLPVIAVSQLSRGPERRNPPKPLMSDLRESGAIEQDADVVAFIYREDYYNEQRKDPGEYEITNRAEILVQKQRNGPTGVLDLRFDKSTTRFDNYSTDDVQYGEREF